MTPGSTVRTATPKRETAAPGLLPRWAWSVLFAMVLGLSACKRTEAPPVPSDPAAARRGRSLFQRGLSVRDTPLLGYLAPERVEMSGAVAACSRCHGPSGRGSREGGVEVPDITPGALGHSRTRAVGELEDRSRPAYTRATLVRAVTEGVSSSGRALGVTMPRYTLTPVEQEELFAYLDQLGEHPDPGVSSTTLTVGAALPLTGRLGPLGKDVAAVVRAVFEDVNASGGVFRRKLALVVEDDAELLAHPSQPEAGRTDATARLLDRGVLALAASVRQGPLPSDALLSREGAPLVLPLALRGGTSAEDSPVFFLYPDEPALARLAVQWLARTRETELRRNPLVVAHVGHDAAGAWVDAVRDETGRRELAVPRELRLTVEDAAPRAGDTRPPSTHPAPAPPQPGEAHAARAAWDLETFLHHAATTAPPAVLYAGSPEGLAMLLRALEAKGLAVPVLAPASLAIPEVVGASAHRVRFLYPAGLGPHAPDLKAFADFMEKHRLQPSHMGFQLGAYAAARVLVEALTRTGAEVTRAGLVQQLEALRDFDTGVSPPVTFGVNRRVGVQGGQLAALDATTGQLTAASDWIPLSP
ncbi:ABC transporter substrate-binding protein [Myxococcus sp. K15C18031901]|uniref:ABC transporter substrate-binding protein n=1 Tax=Myxococcus dinghuensis TaxID=2906761 RepID=UPI0020A76E04|nr:ABC transporter substrate-binding protein [Myxococcus dinghuensis]MCP3100500.1 ABC transporter substrate-binding protein [Myxococcus dinghuensis]